MRFLPFISGRDFLFLYVLFSVIAVIFILKKLSTLDDKDYIITPLDEDKYYVLKNNYNLNDMFYYITYKLYAKGILIKDEEEKSFYVNKDVQVYLSDVEQQVYNLYVEKFSPKDFKAAMIIESYFKNYYDIISNELKANGLIANSEIIQKKKKFSNLSLIIILIPGLWRLIGGIAYSMPTNALFIEIVIILIIAKLIFIKPINQKLTSKGQASIDSFERYYESMKDKNNMDEGTDNYNYNLLMYGFLFGSSWEYFLGVETLRQNSALANNDFGTSYSSCSSCSSDTSDSSGGSSCSSCSSDSSGGSSCSSCSSCGGCGGGD
jgi:hypothetical protein